MEEDGDIHPAFGQRLLQCETWIAKMDKLCDADGLKIIKELQEVDATLVHQFETTQNKLAVMENNIHKGGNDLGKHLEIYAQNDQVQDHRISGLEKTRVEHEQLIQGLQSDDLVFKSSVENVEHLLQGLDKLTDQIRQDMLRA